MNLMPDADAIALAAIKLQYDDLTTIAKLNEFANAFNYMLTDSFNDALRDMIDLDIRDMLHNNNLDFYADADELFKLSESQFIALADHLSDNYDAQLIANKLIANAS